MPKTKCIIKAGKLLSSKIAKINRKKLVENSVTTLPAIYDYELSKVSYEPNTQSTF